MSVLRASCGDPFNPLCGHPIVIDVCDKLVLTSILRSISIVVCAGSPLPSSAGVVLVFPAAGLLLPVRMSFIIGFLGVDGLLSLWVGIKEWGNK